MRDKTRRPRAASDARATVTIERIVAGGAGIARLDGEALEREVVLVPRVAVGEEIAIDIDRSHKPARGRLLHIVKPSADRVVAACPIFEACGGCDLMHLSRDAQRDARLGILANALPPEARATPIHWHEGSPDRGRTRARWHGKGLGDGRTLVGQRAQGSHVLVDLLRCHALDPRLESALEDVHAILIGSRGEGEILGGLGVDARPTIAVQWKGALSPTAFAEAERRVRDGRLAGVALWIEGASKPSTMGDPRPRTPGRGGPDLITPAFGFSQASAVGDAVLVDLVVARAEATGRRVVELFSGSGNFTVYLAEHASEVVAVERAREACELARENVRARSLSNGAARSLPAKIVEADADAWEIPPPAEVVILDPPRTGARGATASIAKRRPRRVVYVSCDPATLGRDLATLIAVGYHVESIDAVDLFPGTSHIESIVTLDRKNKQERVP